MKEAGKRLAERIRREEKEKREAVSHDPWRLRFHLMPPVGWLNDPNGLVQWNGVYHVFFQYSPFDVNGKDKFWGHYISQDLLHWQYLGTPFVTDEDFDRNGVYSGCAYAENGKLYVFYTGNVKLEGDYDYILNGRRASVILAESEDCIHFGEKQLLLTNEDYPSDYTQHIRDPKVFRQDGLYEMVLGGRKKNGRGAVLLYESEDMHAWRLKRELTVSQPFGYMWECPDLFELDGEWFLSLSPQGLPRGEYEFQNVYASGYFHVEGDYRTDGGLEGFTEWDKGFDFYAPQTFQDEQGRRILIGWAGMPDIAGEYDNPTAERGWQHALTVPRQLIRKGGKLLQVPVAELEALRGEEKKLLPGVETDAGAAFDLELTVQDGGKLSVEIAKGLLFEYNGREAILSFRDGAEAVPRKKAPESFAGIGRGRGTRKARVLSLKHLRVLADTSLIEIYLNHGETVFTTRFYPENGLSLCVQGDVQEARLWEMNAMQVRFDRKEDC